jgi:hypothetical protein
MNAQRQEADERALKAEAAMNAILALLKGSGDGMGRGQSGGNNAVEGKEETVGNGEKKDGETELIV